MAAMTLVVSGESLAMASSSSVVVVVVPLEVLGSLRLRFLVSSRTASATDAFFVRGAKKGLMGTDKDDEDAALEDLHLGLVVVTDALRGRKKEWGFCFVVVVVVVVCDDCCGCFTFAFLALAAIDFHSCTRAFAVSDKESVWERERER